MWSISSWQALWFSHYAAVPHILFCMKGASFQVLQFSSDLVLQLHAFVNVNWASDPMDRQSTTNYHLYLRDSLISLKKKK